LSFTDGEIPLVSRPAEIVREKKNKSAAGMRNFTPQVSIFVRDRLDGVIVFSIFLMLNVLKGFSKWRSPSYQA
jgi:hypothetical protein